jgi:ubiquinol-cytochrome c reductase cytochrome b subunit
MLALMFTLLGASATDVLANFFQVSLNEVLWTFRVLVIVVPIVVGIFTWRICIEMQGGGANIGKRKRAVLMTRSATGEYRTVETAPQPDDEHVELVPIPVPVNIELEPADASGNGSDESGVRTVTR